MINCLGEKRKKEEKKKKDSYSIYHIRTIVNNYSRNKRQIDVP